MPASKSSQTSRPYTGPYQRRQPIGARERAEDGAAAGAVAPVEELDRGAYRRVLIPVLGLFGLTFGLWYVGLT